MQHKYSKQARLQGALVFPGGYTTCGQYVALTTEKTVSSRASAQYRCGYWLSCLLLTPNMAMIYGPILTFLNDILICFSCIIIFSPLPPFLWRMCVYKKHIKLDIYCLHSMRNTTQPTQGRALTVFTRLHWYTLQSVLCYRSVSTCIAVGGETQQQIN